VSRQKLSSQEEPGRSSWPTTSRRASPQDDAVPWTRYRISTGYSENTLNMEREEQRPFPSQPFVNGAGNMVNAGIPGAVRSALRAGPCSVSKFQQAANFLICYDNPHAPHPADRCCHSSARASVEVRGRRTTAARCTGHYVPDIVHHDWSMPIFDGTRFDHR